MKIGEYNILPVMTGLMHLDGGAMFGVVPKTLWSKTNPPDELNRIAMCNRAMLLDSGKRKILIDTGIGYKLPKKVNEIYKNYDDPVVENFRQRLTEEYAKIHSK